MNNTDLNRILKRVESTKFKISEILHELKDIEKTVSQIKLKNDENSEIENIPRSNFTTTNKSNVIINNDEDNPDSEIVFITCDGSLTQSRLRISTATAVIFAENYILNEEIFIIARDYWRFISHYQIK